METARRRQPKVSIVIPVRNAERTLDKTFEYLDALDYPAQLLQILIADGGSSDSTIEVVQRWQARRNNSLLVQVPNCASPGHARNEALPSMRRLVAAAARLSSSDTARTITP